MTSKTPERTIRYLKKVTDEDVSDYFMNGISEKFLFQNPTDKIAFDENTVYIEKICTNYLDNINDYIVLYVVCDDKDVLRVDEDGWIVDNIEQASSSINENRVVQAALKLYGVEYDPKNESFYINAYSTRDCVEAQIKLNRCISLIFTLLEDGNQIQ